MTKNAQSRTFKIINKDKWTSILMRLINVLKINLFVIDLNGKTLIMPYSDRHGWKLMANTPLGKNILKAQSIQLDQFKKQGSYLEHSCPLSLNNFLIPISTDSGETVAYMFVGPILVGKRPGNAECNEVAKSLDINPKDLSESMSEIRTVSFVDMKSILELLDEVIDSSVELNLQEHKMIQETTNHQPLPKDVRDVAEDIVSSNLDALLESLLEVALQITKTESGSIMVIDQEKKELTIRVSKGIDQKVKIETHIKVGEGIAGLSAQENESYIIHGSQASSNRIKPFLKRPDIKHSLVTPLRTKNRVFGILSLSTKGDGSDLCQENLDTINLLSNFTSTAIKKHNQ